MIRWELSGRKEILTGPVTVWLDVEDSSTRAEPVTTGSFSSSFADIVAAIRNASDPIGHPVGKEFTGIELANLFKCNRVFERYTIALVEGAQFVNSSEEIGLGAEAEEMGVRS